MPREVVWLHCDTCDAPFRTWDEAERCFEQVPWQQKFDVGDGVFGTILGYSGVVAVISYERKTHKPLYSIRQGDRFFTPVGAEFLVRLPRSV